MELLHLFMTLKLLLHLFQPEFHCIIYDFNRAALYDSCTDRRQAEVLTRLNNTLIVKASSSSMNEARFDKGLS